MLKNYIKIIFRSLKKSKVFAIINVLGMGVALACCVIAYLNYEYAIGFDSNQENIDSIYRIGFERTFEGEMRKYGYVPLALSYHLKANESEQKVIRYQYNGATIRIGEDLFHSNFRYVDDEFFEVFSFPLLYGNKEELRDPSKVFLSYNMARRVFGEENPIGKEIIQVLDSSTRIYTVAGVVSQIQDNSSFDGFQMITNWKSLELTYSDVDEYDWENFTTVFLVIENEDQIPNLETQLQQFVEPQNRAREDFKISKYYIESMKGMALRARAENISSSLRRGIPTPAVFVPPIMALMILLIACFNFTNTSIASSNNRLKEIGLRKVMGSRRKQLIIQFLAENLFLCFVALFIGLFLAEYLAGKYSELFPFLEIAVSYSENPLFFIFLVGLLITAGVAAGAYPAFYLSKFEASSILRGTYKFKGAGVFPKVLLSLQYFTSVLAIIIGIAFIQNGKYQEELDIGIAKTDIIYAGFHNYNEYEVFRNAIAGHPAIEIMGGSQYQFYNTMRNDPVQYEDIQIETNIHQVGDNYLESMGMRILEGRNFIADSKTDQTESILVSETFIDAMGWDNPIGKRIVWADTVSLFVVGVVNDVYSRGFSGPIDPMIIRYVPEENYRFLTVRCEPGKAYELNDFMKSQWDKIFNRPYEGRIIWEDLDGAIDANISATKVFMFLGIIATILSATGLYTLVSLNIIKRTKEIGVRKVLGASVFSIIRNLSNQFMIILTVTAVLGAALGSYFGDQLMSQVFAYHIPMNLLPGLLAVLIMILFSAITIGYKIYSAASTNPVNTLRAE